MITVDQEQFENEVIHSLLKDSRNILMRERLEPQKLVVIDPEPGGWADSLVSAYLPTLCKVLTLDVCIIVPSNEGDGCDCWLILPYQLVHDSIRDFLIWYLQSSIDLKVIHSSALTKIGNSAIDEVSKQVATCWDRMGF